MTNRIYANVQPVQTPDGDSIPDGRIGHTERPELPQPDDAMLALGETRDGVIDGNAGIEGGLARTWAAFRRTIKRFAAHVGHGWMVEARSARVARGLRRVARG